MLIEVLRKLNYDLLNFFLEFIITNLKIRYLRNLICNNEFQNPLQRFKFVVTDS